MTATASHASNAKPSDAEHLASLLARCGLGDRASFAALYRASRARLYAVALRVLRNADLAEEALQDAFVKVWHNAVNYRAQESAPMTWMTTIVRNQCLDTLRRHATENSLRVEVHDDEDDTSWIERVQADTPEQQRLDPLRQAINTQEVGLLQHCIDQLKAAPRELISRAFVDGATHQELAEQTKLPVGTVKTHIRRGLQALRACLQKRSGAGEQTEQAAV